MSMFVVGSVFLDTREKISPINFLFRLINFKRAGQMS